MQVDYLVVGGGIAGTSIAAQLAPLGSTVVLEREPQPGYHATGRSAAIFTSLYGAPTVRALTRASCNFLEHPPDGFSDTPLLRPRGVLFVGTQGAASVLAKLRTDEAFDRCARILSMQEACSMVPILRPEHAHFAAYEPAATDIDVHALHSGYLRALRARGGSIFCNWDVQSIEQSGAGWTVRGGEAVIRARVLINAAGAWADYIAVLAGIPALGIAPMRRTAVLVDAPAGHSIETWPVVAALDTALYFKPDAGKLLLSPMDETPSAACDAQPEDIDVATAVDNFEQVTTQTVQRVSHRWAGLRSFTHDRVPVAGFATGHASFFWLAGQGGFGIQTVAALSQAAAALVQGQELPDDLREYGITAAALSPDRLRLGAYKASDPLHEFD